MSSKPQALPTVETAQKLGLLPEEYERIIVILGRKPNFTELSIFSVMWSEHCSYKNSIVWLKTLPKDSPRMLAKAGEENAGLVDIGDGWACSFKIESHNHPSALEPYQGAATGVGGINRDIFTMGARPIAQLNSLRFGPPSQERSRWHLKGVVKGIGDYGNAFGIPTVGGEVYFDECYTINPLVNAFSAGIVRTDEVARAAAPGPGNPVYIVGASTGKDGIHGATFASEDISDKSVDKLPAVQVGDPFMEKLLLEATLEVIKTGKVAGIQDMGAAGIICSTSEMSAKSGTGMDIWLDEVPTRQANMQPFEMLLSESQERMLVVVEKGAESLIEGIFDKWDLHCKQIGVVTDTGRLHFYHQGEKVADVPSNELVLGGGAPQYYRAYAKPSYLDNLAPVNVDIISQPNYAEAAKYLLAHPNICSRNWISRQYDSMVGTANMSTNKPSAAAVVAVKGTEKAIAITVDCNGRYVWANPEVGTMIAVAEAARNVVCAGGIPVAITNNLNFGNPYNPEVYYHFVHAIKGMKTACEKFETPVTGGNVSFYNQSADGGAVFPTPTIGMLGLLEDRSLHTGIAFQEEGDTILLIGPINDDLANSEYLHSYLGIKPSPVPYFDLDEEYAVQEVIKSIIQQRLVRSCQDVSDGGLWVSLVECAIAGGFGFNIESLSDVRKDAFLFGQGQSRVVVSATASHVNAIISQALATGIDCHIIGSVTSKASGLKVDHEVLVSYEEADDLYTHSLARQLHEA